MLRVAGPDTGSAKDVYCASAQGMTKVNGRHRKHEKNKTNKKKTIVMVAANVWEPLCSCPFLPQSENNTVRPSRKCGICLNRRNPATRNTGKSRVVGDSSFILSLLLLLLFKKN